LSNSNTPTLLHFIEAKLDSFVFHRTETDTESKSQKEMIASMMLKSHTLVSQVLLLQQLALLASTWRIQIHWKKKL
jgi:hypothetical protein